MKRLTTFQRILVAGTLFGMFFGAGNLIFPVHLGQLAGRSVLPAMIGFIITAVGIPILGVAAIGSTHSDGLQMLAGKVGRKYSYIFTTVLYLTIGPFFAIPRCATTSFTTGIQPLLQESSNSAWILFLFSLCFFALVLFFSLRPNRITVWIGKIINPVFLLFLLILVLTVFLSPGAPASSIAPEGGYGEKAFFLSLVEGYGTMDAIAGLAFGIVVVEIIRKLGVTEDGAVASDVLRSGILTGLLMALIYVLTILMGARSRGFTETSENGGIALTEIASHYLGKAGGLILAITITFACLKTSVGLVISCSETFTRMFPGKLSYRSYALIFTVFSFIVSNVGLTMLITYSVPVLMFIYPPAITLILLALTGKLFGHDRKVYVCVTVFTVFAAFFDLLKTLPAGLREKLCLDPLIGLAGKYLPFYELNLGWVVPAFLGLVLGLILRKTGKRV